MRLSGTVDKLTDRGFGFIASDSGESVFLHATALIERHFTELRVGDRVSFEIEDAPRGLRAVRVQVIGDEVWE